MRESQPQKQYVPKLVTDDEITIDSRDEQSLKQSLSKIVTDSGITTDLRDLQSMYLEVIDSQLFAVNTVEKRIGYYLWGYGK